MYPGVDPSLFTVHDWRNDIVTIGTVPKEFIEEVSRRASSPMNGKLR